MVDGKFILVVNQYNCDNLGDNLLNSLLCKNIKDAGYNVINRGFAQTQPQKVSYKTDYSESNNIRELVKAKMPEHIKYLIKYKNRLDKETANISTDNCIAIVIGGGQLLKSNSVFIDCLRYWVNWANTNSIPVYVYGVGIDTGLSLSEIKIYKRILKSVEYINCRDYESEKILKNVLGLNEVHVSPDVAFLLDRAPTKETDIILVMPYDYRTAVRAFGFSQTKDEYYTYIKDMIEATKENKRVLLAATTSADANECFMFADFLRDYGIEATISQISDYEQLIATIGNAATVITGRMHAMIICTVLGTPVIPIIVSDKILQFKNEYLDEKGDINKIRQSSREGIAELLRQIGEEER